MISTIIFDLGDVFIDLEIEATRNAFRKLGLTNEDHPVFVQANNDFEIGAIDETSFLASFQIDNQAISKSDLKNAWNTIIGDFPQRRLDFLKNVATKYKLFLLSNTDAIHIEYFKNKVGATFYNEFELCFEKLYFSFEMGLRKPDKAIFQKIIDEQNLIPAETLFVDDKIENILAAQKSGLQTYQVNNNVVDVCDLEKFI